MKHTLLSRQLLLPIISLLMVLVIAGAWLTQRMAMVDKGKWQQQQLQAELAAVNQQIALSAQDRQWIAQYSADYRQLQRNGFIGDDQRLVWNQALISAGARLGLTAVSFDIAPQQLHQPELPSGAFKLMDTPVQFAAEIPHEGIFAQLLDDLRSQNHGIFTVRECTLSHVMETQPLQAQCVFEWHTLAQKATS